MWALQTFGAGRKRSALFFAYRPRRRAGTASNALPSAEGFAGHMAFMDNLIVDA